MPFLDGTVTAVHSGSLALAMQPGAAVLEEFLASVRSSVTVSIDLNLRPSIRTDADRERSRVERQIRLAHIVKASEEDLSWLYPGIPVEQIAADWHLAGAACCVVTLGPNGAYLVAPNGLAYRRTAPVVDVIDTVGAGDSFTGAMLATLADFGALGRDPRARLEDVTSEQWLATLDRAGMVAAITCTRRGANPPSALESALH
jgi:fructokinase